MKSTVFDMAIADAARKIITVSQDKRITVLDLDTGKIENSFVPNIPLNDSSTKLSPFMNSIVTDSHGKILCTSSTDKVVHLIDVKTGSSIFQGHGHGDLITGITRKNYNVKIGIGRPVWRNVFTQISHDHREEDDIGVLFCGAPRLRNELYKLCSEDSENEEKSFKFHSEEFQSW